MTDEKLIKELHDATKEMHYIAVVHVVGDRLQEVADEDYGGSLNDALEGELGWCSHSGISVEILYKVKEG